MPIRSSQVEGSGLVLVLAMAGIGLGIIGWTQPAPITTHQICAANSSASPPTVSFTSGSADAVTGTPIPSNLFNICSSNASSFVSVRGITAGIRFGQEAIWCISQISSPSNGVLLVFCKRTPASYTADPNTCNCFSVFDPLTGGFEWAGPGSGYINSTSGGIFYGGAITVSYNYMVIRNDRVP